MLTAKKNEKQKCQCTETHCDVITRFLERVESSICKTNTKKMCGYHDGFNTIHFKTQVLVGTSNDLKSDEKEKTKRSEIRPVVSREEVLVVPLSCKGVLQVFVHSGIYG